MKKPKIVITIPAYNEEKTLGKVLKEIHRVMKKTKHNYMIQVIDDGSKDKTTQVAKKNGVRVHSHKRNRGLAQTFRTEMEQCVKLNADLIVHTDADGQYDSRFIPKLIAECQKGYDLVLGSRFKGDIESMPIMKRIGNKVFSKVISSLIGVKISDSTTGFRCFTKEVAEEIEFINTFTYTQEQIIRAAKQNFKITEIPIKARKTRDSRLFSSPFQYAWRAWINILRIYRNYDPLRFFGILGGIIFSLGFLLGLWFIYLFVTTGRVGHPNLTMLSVLLIIMSVQTLTFGLLADMIKK